MSLECIVWAMAQTTGSATRKSVLIALSNRANSDRDGECWPKIKRIAADTELSEASVKRAIKELEGLGMIEVIPRFHDGVQISNAYRILMGVGSHGTQGGFTVNPGWVQAEPRVGSQRATEPVIEPSIEPVIETTPCSPPAGGKKNSRRKHRNQSVSENPPTLQEWIAYGLEKYPMAPKLEMKKAFDYYEGQGWTRKDTETTRVDLTNWKSALTNWLAGWVQKNPSEVTRWRRSQVPAPQRENARADLSAALVTPAEPSGSGMSIMDRYRSMNNA